MLCAFATPHLLWVLLRNVLELINDGLNYDGMSYSQTGLLDGKKILGESQRRAVTMPFSCPVIYETSCAAGAPLLMKKRILTKARSWREDDQQYTVEQRAFETVLRYLDEPLHAA
jgi:hypothetical protein